jgi:hypothetical protein
VARRVRVSELPAAIARRRHDRLMPSRTWMNRTVAVRLPVAIPVAAAVVVCALVVGALVGLKLPFGAKPATVTHGMAIFSGARHQGTFQPDGGPPAWIPGEVAWVDSSGQSEAGSMPSCLRGRDDATLVQASVEAGYARLRLPDNASTWIVGWIRCL